MTHDPTNDPKGYVGSLFSGFETAERERERGRGRGRERERERREREREREGGVRGRELGKLPKSRFQEPS